jgi:hypothetical protein
VVGREGLETLLLLAASIGAPPSLSP